MNLIILSSIPDYVLAMIIIEAIIMMALGVFLIVDIIRSRIKTIKKEQKEAEEKRNQAREASISLDSAEDEAYISSGLSELEYLRRMNKEQKEYIELLEKRINLKRELQEDVSNMEYSEGEVEEPDELDQAVNDFLNSIPSKEEEYQEEVYEESEETDLEECAPTGEDTIIPADEPFDPKDKKDEDDSVVIHASNIKALVVEPSEDIKKDSTSGKDSKGVVITASSIKAVVVDPEEKRKKQEKIAQFIKEQEANEVKPKVEDDPYKDEVYDIVEPWYCLAKPFVKKKKKYNNY